MSRKGYVIIDGVTNETYTTPIATYDVNRFVSVSYTKMKRPNVPYVSCLIFDKPYSDWSVTKYAISMITLGT